MQFTQNAVQNAQCTPFSAPVQTTVSDQLSRGGPAPRDPPLFGRAASQVHQRRRLNVRRKAGFPTAVKKWSLRKTVFSPVIFRGDDNRRNRVGKCFSLCLPFRTNRAAKQLLSGFASGAPFRLRFRLLLTAPEIFVLCRHNSNTSALKTICSFL